MGFVVGPLLSFDVSTKRKWIIDTLDTLLMCANLEVPLLLSSSTPSPACTRVLITRSPSS